MADYVLRSYEFRREREATWSELEELMSEIDAKGLARLDAEQISRLPELYRSALSSLSVAQAISLDKSLIDYLEGLCQRAYLAVYGRRRQPATGVARFFRYRFPSLVWGMRGAVLLSFLLMAGGVLVGFALTMDDPDRFYQFVNPQMSQGRGPDATRDELADILYSEHDASDGLTIFASFLFTHNASIGMLCFALGIAAAVPVLYLLFTNGLILGAFAAIHVQKGLGLDFWGWVLPHGVTELLAVILCGAAGLTIGRSIVFLGRFRRLDNLVRAGRRAALVVIGAILLFMVAALIEGFFRQLVHSVPVRFGVVVLTGVLWAWYFVRAREYES